MLKCWTSNHLNRPEERRLIDMHKSDLPTLERKIGNTVYCVEATLSKTATENPVEKLRRIILKESERLKANQI